MLRQCVHRLLKETDASLQHRVVSQYDLDLRLSCHRRRGHPSIRVVWEYHVVDGEGVCRGNVVIDLRQPGLALEINLQAGVGSPLGKVMGAGVGLQ